MKTKLKCVNKKPINKITHHIGDKHSDKTEDRGMMLLVELAKEFFTESIINSNHNHQQHVQYLAG